MVSGTYSKNDWFRMHNQNVIRFPGMCLEQRISHFIGQKLMTKTPKKKLISSI